MNMPQAARVLCFALTLALPLPAVAQSLIELPQSFDLGAPAASDRTADADAACENMVGRICMDGQGTVGFSLDDVVNLGIIDREEAQSVVSASTGSASAGGMTQALPSIDLEVLFDYNADTIRADQLPQLIDLAGDLRGLDLAHGYLVIMGHTDAVGSAAYNEDLSLRRARSVAEFLRDSAGLPRERIRTSGQGFRYLKYPDQPEHGANRRVQIILAGQ